MGMVNVYENGKIYLKIKKDGSCLVRPSFLFFLIFLLVE